MTAKGCACLPSAWSVAASFGSPPRFVSRLVTVHGTPIFVVKAA